MCSGTGWSVIVGKCLSQQASTTCLKKTILLGICIAVMLLIIHLHSSDSDRYKLWSSRIMNKLNTISKTYGPSKDLQNTEHTGTNVTIQDKKLRQKKAKRLPTAVLIGVKKSGTYALRWILERHPDLVFPVRSTGTYFHIYSSSQWPKYLNEYRNQMTPSYSQQITVDRNPNYYTEPYVPKLIHEYNSSMKIMLIVTDPIRRFISDYYFEKRKGRLPGRCKTKTVDWTKMPKPFDKNTLEDIVQLPEYRDCRNYILKPSFYYYHYSNWIKHFKPSQIHIVDGESFMKNPLEEIKKVELFLGIRSFFQPESFHYDEDKGFYCCNDTGHIECLKDDKGFPHPRITAKSKEILTDLLREDVHLFHKETLQTFEWIKNY